MASIWQNNKLLRKWEQKNFKKSTCIFICVYFFVLFLITITKKLT